MSADFFDDVVFPTSISLYSFKGKRSRKTRIITNLAGFEKRKSEQVITRRTFDAGMVARPASQWRLIDDLFEVVDGPGIGFLLQDPTDYQISDAQGVLVRISGNAYSLQKVAVVASHTAYRGIAKPKLGTVLIFKTNAGATTTVGSGSYAIDYTTGVVTFANGYVVAGDSFTWSGEFYLPARFASDDLDWQTVDKQARGELLIFGPSIPIIEIPWPGLLYVPPT